MYFPTFICQLICWQNCTKIPEYPNLSIRFLYRQHIYDYPIVADILATIVFNGNKAAKSYAQYLKKHSDTTNILGHLHSCACPSTSPAIRCTGLTFDDLVNRWKDILIWHKLFLYERKTCQRAKAHKKGSNDKGKIAAAHKGISRNLWTMQNSSE